MFIIGHIFSSILWGLVSATAVTALVAYAVKAANASRTITLAGWCAALVMAVLVGFQTTLMAEAIKAKSVVTDIKDTISSLAAEADEFTDAASTAADMEDKIDALRKDYPFIGLFVDVDNISAENAKDYAESVSNNARSFLNWYIVRRIGWGLLFTLLGAGAIASLSHTASSRRAYKSDYRSQRDTYR